MAKPKKDKPRSIPNKHLFARASFLYQAAAYLQAHSLPAAITDGDIRTNAEVTEDGKQTAQPRTKDENVEHRAVQLERPLDRPNTSEGALGTAASSSLGQQRLFVSQMKNVAKNPQVHLSPEIKQTICKRCDAVMTPGATCSTAVENKSKGGKKPWADILVSTCLLCGAQKRIPIGATRQPKKKTRRPAKVTVEDQKKA